MSCIQIRSGRRARPARPLCLDLSEFFQVVRLLPGDLHSILLAGIVFVRARALAYWKKGDAHPVSSCARARAYRAYWKQRIHPLEATRLHPEFSARVLDASLPESGNERIPRPLPDARSDRPAPLDTQGAATGNRCGSENQRRTNSMKSTRSILKWGGAALLALFATSQASAAGTPANTLISNTANADYSINGNPAATVSDTVDFNVDELIDVNVVRVGGAVTVATPENNVLIAFDVTNTGNGEEIFDLGLNGNVSGDDFDVTFTGNFAYLDTNGNQTFDAGTDTAFNPVTGTSDLTLQPDETRRVFILSDIPGGLTDGDVGDVRLSAESTTGALAGAVAGTTAAGLGTGGVDAVVGSTQGTGADQQRYIVSAVSVAIDKTVLSVDDGFGGNELVPGAVVTYRIAVDVSGSGTAEGLLISDTIAEAATSNLAYLKSSVVVNGVSQTDANDTVTGSEFTTVNFNDAADGSLASGQAATGGVDIAVDLGDVSPGGGTTSYEIDLQAEIQ